MVHVGVTFSLTGYDSIPTDGSGRVLITDINPNGDNDEDALICHSEIDTFESEFGNWFLHPTESSTDGGDPNDHSDTGDRIVIGENGEPDPRGWNRSRDLDAGHRLVTLRRASATAEEGVFTCAIHGDINIPRSVGVYYPSELLSKCDIL